MIRVVLFDLGNTLLRESTGTAFPHAHAALRTIGGFSTPAGAPLLRCLASNFPATLPVPPAQLPQVFSTFLAIVERAGLAEFFEPVERHITLSAHAGVPKPQPEFFKTALGRLGIQAEFDECLFVTEDPEHITRCKGLGMKTLQFGGHQSQPPPGSDFTDWSEAPLLIAHLVSPDGRADLGAALRGYLEEAHDLRVVSCEAPAGGPIRVQAKAWAPLADAGLGDLNGVLVEVPVTVRVRLDDRGRVAGVEGAKPSAEAIREASQHVQSLASSGQVENAGGASPLGTTHRVEVDPQGRRYLKRKRFSAY
jgi:hypothetical protein